MIGKCEICGGIDELTRVYAFACDKDSPHATLCDQCKKKYFDYMLAGQSGIFNYLPSVPYIPNWSYAENLVHAYGVRFERVREPHKEYTGPIWAKEKETHTMKVSYNGFTGELLRLERTHYGDCRYALDIYDSGKNAKISFTGVKLEDVKFLGGVVSFGG